MKLARLLSLIIVGIFILSVAGCGSGGKKSLTAADQTDEPREGRDRELFEDALKEMQKKRYEQGRILINTMITTYSDSPLLPMAKLTIGDSYYREGGTANLVQAEAEYRDWLQFFPNHELAPEVMLKLAEIQIRQVQSYDREKGPALRAEKQLLELQRRFPETKDNPKVQEYTELVQELLARADLGVARFYFERRDAWKAAELRCQEIVDKYPNFTETDVALWYLARSLEEEENTEDAAKYYARIVREFPKSKYRDVSAEKLELFGKPVPDPDPNVEERIVERRGMMSRAMESLFGPNIAVSKEGILLKQGDKIDESTYQLIMNSVGNSATSPESTRTGVDRKPAQTASTTGPEGSNGNNSASVPKAKEKAKGKKDKKNSKSESDANAKP
jgi:outer membrane protein assembly factor BamD